MKLPNRVFGIETKRAYEDYLHKSLEKKEPQQEPSQQLNVRADIKEEDYIKIPSTSIVIARQESHKGLKWENTHCTLAENKLFMPTPALFMPYFVNVRDAAQNKITLYTTDNNPIPRNEVEDLLKYLSTNHRNGCWTWLDARFINDDRGNAEIEYGHHPVPKGKIQGASNVLQGKRSTLERCIQDDCFVSLEFNAQGLPIKESSHQEYKQGENIYYMHPRNGAVAWFGADSDRAALGCGRNPSDSYPALGVFSCADLGDLQNEPPQ